jgi:hypothetical protein
MANDIILISELPVATAVNNADLTVVVQGGVTKQAKVSLYPTSENLTASQVRDLLMTLIDNARLPKMSIRGADFALNYRAQGDVNSEAFQVWAMTNILRNDIWIHTGASTATIRTHDILMAMVDNPPTLAYNEPTQWKVIRIGPHPFSDIPGNVLGSGGNELQTILENLSIRSQFKGYAYTTLDPIIPQAGSHFYFAQWNPESQQTFVHFNNIVVTPGELAILVVTPTQYIKQSLGIIELPEPITAVQVRDLLHTLTGDELMSGGKVKYTDTQTITSIISLLHTRQNMVWDDEFTYQMNWMVLYNKVWYRSKNNSNHGKNPVTETDWWESINALSGTQIAALLNSLTTINEMVIANRIKYNDSLTVAGKIEAMDIGIEKKQNRITRNRYLYSNPINGKAFIIGGKTADIFSLRINRTPLEGVRAFDFNVEAAAYDYIYKTINETDTQITLSPDLGIEFKAGTIIDVQW